VQSDPDVTTAHDDLAPLRLPGAATFLVAAALWLLLPFLELLRPPVANFPDTAGFWAVQLADGFTSPPVLLLPVLAVLLVSRPVRLPQATLVGWLAVVLYVVVLLGGGVTLIVGLVADSSPLDGVSVVGFVLRQVSLLAVAAVAMGVARRLSGVEGADDQEE
jgi:hypothetical protein